MRLFKQVDQDDQDDQYTSDVKVFWQEVIDSSYALALRAQHQKTGLVPDWCGTDGRPKDPENGARDYDQFNYDAVRTPWRMAWAYYWFGDSLAEKFNFKIANGPINIRYPAMCLLPRSDWTEMVQETDSEYIHSEQHGHSVEPSIHRMQVGSTPAFHVGWRISG